MSTELVIFACPTCGSAITGALRPLPSTSALCYDDGKPAVPEGFFASSDDEYFNGSVGRTLVNLADLVDTKSHPDYRRSSGCCGPDGCDGPNLVCSAGHEVAIVRADCWMAHAAILVANVLRSSPGES